MERTSKQKLGWFFDQWLRRPGYPTVEAKWKYDAGFHETTVTLTQSGPFGEYDMPLTVAIVDSSGKSTREIARFKPGSGPVQLHIASATQPASVVLDPDVELLALLRVVVP